MKKIMLLLVLCFAVPAMGTATIDAVDQGGTVDITYAVSDANLIRAVAVDVTVDGTVVITGVTAAIEGESTAAAPGYGIFPGTIEIDVNEASPTYGEVISYGSPMAPVGDPGAAGDLGGQAITLELGSVYVGDPNSPGTGGLLCTIDYTGEGLLTITENAIRGGIVMEDVALEPPLVLATDVPIGEGVCLGDAADIYASPGPDGRVDLGDLNYLVGLMMAAGPGGDGYWAIPAGQEAILDFADIYASPGADGRVDLGDLNYLVGLMMAAGPGGDGYWAIGSCIVLP